MPPKRREQPWVGQETGSDNWYVYWYEPGTARVKRRSTGSRDRKEADAALGRFITARAETVEIIEPERFTPVLPPDRFAVETAIRHYLEQRVSDLSSQQTAAYCAQALLKHLTGTMVGHLTPAAWKRYGRERGVKPATVRREQGFLRAAINLCVKDGLLTVAPDFDLAPMGAGRTRALDESEIESLLSECHEPHLRLFVLLALNTGARRGAILDLTWPQIDLVNGRINLNPADRVQTAKRRAVVPVSETLGAALQEAQSVACSLYVVAYRGQPVSSIKTALGHACERAGLKGVTSHTLRHTAGTLMAKAGIDLWVIAQLLGHSTAKTSELYAHFQPSWGRDAVAVLGSITKGR